MTNQLQGQAAHAGTRNTHVQPGQPICDGRVLVRTAAQAYKVCENSLQQENDRLRGRVAEWLIVAHEVDTLETVARLELASVQAEAEAAAQAHEQQVSALQAKMAQQQAAAQAAAEASQQREATLRAENTQLGARVQALQDNDARLRADNARLQTQNAKLRTAANTHKESAKAAQAEVSDLKRGLQASDWQLASVRTELRRVEGELEDVKEQLQNAMEQQGCQASSRTFRQFLRRRWTARRLGGGTRSRSVGDRLSTQANMYVCSNITLYVANTSKHVAISYVPPRLLTSRAPDNVVFHWLALACFRQNGLIWF